MITYRNIKFPIVISALTLILVGAVAFSFWSKQSNDKNSTPVVSESSYQKELQNVLKNFSSDYDSAPDDLSRVAKVDKTLELLLALRVPATYRDLHLSIALNLQEMREGLKASDDSAVKSYEKLKQTILKFDWLKL